MSTHPDFFGKDNWPMRKLITTVFTVAIVGPFAYFATAEAVSIKQHLNEQHQQIQHLNVESAKIDKKLEKAVETKKQAEAETQQLEQQANESLAERQRLEAELGAN